MNKKYSFCIIGMGPSGLAAALSLAKTRYSKDSICIDAGDIPAERKCRIITDDLCCKSESCNIINGLGGCSYISGGKVSLFPAGKGLKPFLGNNTETKSKLNKSFSQLSNYISFEKAKTKRKEIAEFRENCKSSGFKFTYYDVYSFNQIDAMNGFYKMLKDIYSSGIKILFKSKVTDIQKEGKYFKVTIENQQKGIFSLYSEIIVLAVGRSGISLRSHIDDCLGLNHKEVFIDYGVRLEFPAHLWDDIDKVHGDLKLKFNDARTFCINKNGFLTPYYLCGISIIEGRTESSIKSEFTNLAILIKNDNFQKKTWDEINSIFENISSFVGDKPLRQTLKNFLENKQDSKIDIMNTKCESTIAYWKWGNINSCYEINVSKRIRYAVDFFISNSPLKNHLDKITVYGPVLDYYWPRYSLDKNFQTNINNFYVIGDATGYFHGILQSFSSGCEFVNNNRMMRQMKNDRK